MRRSAMAFAWSGALGRLAAGSSARRSARISMVLVGGAMAGSLAGCQSYVIEYRYRPAFHQMASDEPLPDEVVTEDGRIIRYVSTPLPELRKELDARDRGEVEETGDQEQVTPIWQEDENGDVVLYCVTPEHVLANTMNCLRLERYDLMYEQLLAERTRNAYEASGRGPADFAAWCLEHRSDLMEMLNRMGFGFLGGDVVLENLGNGVMRSRFTPRVGDQFRFREVLILSDPPGMNLLEIR
ncbi:MAG: hypothetical protein ACO3YY_05575 [Phycisphaerales bacterium]|jgi:hypothetical protein|nr:hypothetical protein [Planctomycetota bacterium]